MKCSKQLGSKKLFAVCCLLIYSNFLILLSKLHCGILFISKTLAYCFLETFYFWIVNYFMRSNDLFSVVIKDDLFLLDLSCNYYLSLQRCALTFLASYTCILLQSFTWQQLLYIWFLLFVDDILQIRCINFVLNDILFF